MNLFLCETLANDVRYKQTDHPSEGSTNWKKQTQEKHIFRFKASENENVKVDLHQRWSERLTDSIGNTNAQQTKRAYRKNVKRHWRTFPIEKRKQKKLTQHSEKNKKKEGKRLPISNIYFYILIYQNKKTKEKRTWTVKENTQKGAIRDGTFSVGSSQGRACNHAIVPHSTGRHQTHRLKDAAGIRQNKVSTAKHQTK